MRIRRWQFGAVGLFVIAVVLSDVQLLAPIYRAISTLYTISGILFFSLGAWFFWQRIDKKVTRKESIPVLVEEEEIA